MNFKQVLNKLDEFEEAVKKAVSDVRLDNDVVVSVFETNIRVLGYESYVYIIYYTAFVIFLRFVLTALFEVLFFSWLIIPIVVFFDISTSFYCHWKEIS